MERGRSSRCNALALFFYLPGAFNQESIMTIFARPNRHTIPRVSGRDIPQSGDNKEPVVLGIKAMTQNWNHRYKVYIFHPVQT